MSKCWQVINSSFKYWKFILEHMWTTHIIILDLWSKHIMLQYQVNHIMFQDQFNHICINLNLALYYICIKIMLKKLACHMAIIQTSGSNCTSVYIETKSYIYVSSLYIYSIYPPFHCHCQCLLRSLSFFSSCLVVIPNAEQEGQISLAETVVKPKFVN